MNYLWTNGCFDILHVGHIKLLNYIKMLAKSVDLKVVIGLDSDYRVQQMKGYGRPINCFKDRAEMIREIFNDDVQIQEFQDDTALKTLLRTFQPKIMVVGSDWKGKKVIGAEFAHEVAYFERDEHSTTKTVQKIMISPTNPFGGQSVPQYNPGWSCPNCGRGYSPHTTMCAYCGPQQYSGQAGNDSTGVRYLQCQYK